jgi:hypothetical protein
MNTHRYLIRALVFSLIVYAIVHVAIRGPINYGRGNNLVDFGNVYAASKMWVAGENAYDKSQFARVWTESSPGAYNLGTENWTFVLPPGALPILAPLGLLPAWWAATLWIIASLLLIVVCIAVTTRIAGLQWNDWRTLVLVAVALAWAPTQLMFASGQPALLAVTAILLATCIAGQRPLVGAALLGLALALKPQLAGPFVLWFVFFRQFRTAGWALVLGLALTLIGVVQLEAGGHAWLSTWFLNIADTTGGGAINDPQVTSHWRNQMIDLGVLLHSFVDSQLQVRAYTQVLSFLIAVLFVALLGRVKDQPNKLLPIALLGTLTMLPVYHRVYDAMLMLPAVAWGLMALRTESHRWAVATLFGCAMLLVPYNLPHHLPRGLEHTMLWNALIYPHHALAVLWVSTALTGALVATSRSLVRTAAPASDSVAPPPAADAGRI